MNPYSTQCIEDDDVQAVARALRSSRLTQGALVEEFEAKLCEYVGVKHALTFNSATSALYAAYRAFGIGGGEVITTPISFVATANMMLECGAKPVFCDVKRDGNLNEALVKSLITPRTKAVVSVDYSGKSVDADQLREICSRHDLKFISDSSHAIGGRRNGKKIGTFADATIFSLHALKPFTTGEGGVLVSNDADFCEKARLIRSHGVIKKELWNSDVASSGFNFRMTELQAALGISQLDKLERFLNVREEIACSYDEAFKGNPYFFTLHETFGCKTTNHLYPIILAPEFSCSKEDIFRALWEEGLGVQVHYKPICDFSLYKRLFGEKNLPVAGDFYRSEISIPCHQKMDVRAAKECAETILRVFERFKVFF